ncbi:uncharacterized protein EV154DRAFT_565388 [Mucor mucedo]|uniref:uncharacterized protein n=1 Tax=Mucor mucedo TaxID=29922 RepID=UPI002221122F|nr:uncharacterized protein EV154DRAFT_565388 [Mucor mucedo]KAI7889424.1 hypothetical protein EV154DRAFT_565388 [Mucor mucedo]
MSQDINYAESIITDALQATVNEGSEVYWDLFLNTAKDKVINSYCGTHLDVLKRAWKRRFKEVASRLKFRVKNDSGDANSWQILISNELKAKRKSSSLSASTHDTIMFFYGRIFMFFIRSKPQALDNERSW